MNFACIGGDRRQIETARFLKSRGFEVCTFGTPFVTDIKCADNIKSAIDSSTAVILPVPVSRDNITVNIQNGVEPILINDVLNCHPKIVFGGIIKPDFEQKLNSENIKYYDYFKSESLTVKNAVLTAESAVAIAINSTETAIFGSQSLVIGYGRIGKQLSKYLKSFGSIVTATSRDEGTRAVIESDGLIAMDTNLVRENCGIFDYIFNTVPYPIMDDSFFSNCKSKVFIEDLATDSGADLNAAKKRSVSAAIYSGLPGKSSPVTAAKYIAEEILRKVDFL